MAEETELKEGDGGEKKEGKAAKGKGKWFKKIPKDVLFSPGGMVLLFFAVVMEIVDLLLPPGGYDSLIIELIPELFFCLFLKVIADVPFVAQIIPLLIERIPIISDIVPTWLLKLLF